MNEQLQNKINSFLEKADEIPFEWLKHGHWDKKTRQWIPDKGFGGTKLKVDENIGKNPAFRPDLPYTWNMNTSLQNLEKKNKNVSKAKVYLEQGQVAPQGSLVMRGEHGGRYYESQVRTSFHAMDRISQRLPEVKSIASEIQKLDNADLPNKDWWYKVAHDGYICGIGNVVKTVLSPSMYPKGMQVNA